MARKKDGVYDVCVIGAGVSGNASTFALNYATGVQRVLHLEGRHGNGQVNSNVRNNAGSSHHGSKETNYALPAALKVQAAARLMEGFVDSHCPHVSTPLHNTMVIGVGEAEVAKLRNRYAEFLPHYPNLRLLDRDEIAAVEPKVMEGRDPSQQIVALSEGKGRAMNYQKLADELVRHSGRGEASIDHVYNLPVSAVTQLPDGNYAVTFGQETAVCRSVIVAAGNNSLAFAHRMGIGLEYGMLPMRGDFWVSRESILGKVYTVQDDNIPLAALHADAAPYDPGETRWGPTAAPTFLLERDNWKTMREFARTGMFSYDGIATALKIARGPSIGRFLLKNAGYGLPYFGPRLFLKECRKIAPSIQLENLRLDKGSGGIRGQLVHFRTRSMAKVDQLTDPSDRLAFIMAPSPGATGCLGSGLVAMKMLERGLPGFRFDETRFRQDLGVETRVATGKVIVEVRPS